MKTLFFIDLDDTIFQTKRKNSQGIYQATISENEDSYSYMTKAQKAFLEIFLNSNEVKIIPLTARDYNQYKKVELSKHNKIDSASVFFSGMIIDKGEIDLKWSSHIEESYKNLETSMEEMFELMKKYTDESKFKLYMLDKYYPVIKNRDKNSYTYMEENTILANQLKEIMTEEYFMHFNSNNISILPNFLNKINALNYFVEKYNPDLVLGAGDSITDLDFINKCHFKIIPANSQLDKFLLS